MRGCREAATLASAQPREKWIGRIATRSDILHLLQLTACSLHAYPIVSLQVAILAVIAPGMKQLIGSIVMYEAE